MQLLGFKVLAQTLVATSTEASQKQKSKKTEPKPNSMISRSWSNKCGALEPQQHTSHRMQAGATIMKNCTARRKCMRIVIRTYMQMCISM